MKEFLDKSGLDAFWKVIKNYTDISNFNRPQIIVDQGGFYTDPDSINEAIVGIGGLASDPDSINEAIVGIGGLASDPDSINETICNIGYAYTEESNVVKVIVGKANQIIQEDN